MFQRPLPFGAVYDPEIADAGVLLRPFWILAPLLDEIGDGNGGQQPAGGGGGQDRRWRCQGFVSVAEGLPSFRAVDADGVGSGGVGLIMACKCCLPPSAAAWAPTIPCMAWVNYLPNFSLISENCCPCPECPGTVS